MASRMGKARSGPLIFKNITIFNSISFLPNLSLSLFVSLSVSWSLFVFLYISLYLCLCVSI
jgi:hypothetical protein